MKADALWQDYARASRRAWRSNLWAAVCYGFTAVCFMHAGFVFSAILCAVSAGVSVAGAWYIARGFHELRRTIEGMENDIHGTSD